MYLSQLGINHWFIDDHPGLDDSQSDLKSMTRADSNLPNSLFY